MPTKIEKDALTGTDTTGHEWDGLKELNTPCPKWWLNVLYATIVFAIVWMILYPSLPIRGATGITGWVAREAVVHDVAAANERMSPMMNRIREATPQQIMADAELRGFAMAGGRIAFANNCAACHGAGGQGAPGGFPSLADDDWIWGGSFDAIHSTIVNGVRAGESDEERTSMMPRFGDGVLTPAQIGEVSQFVVSLSGRSTDAAAVERGRPIYAENCVSCHGENGEGNRDLGGLRLNDRVWLHATPSDPASIARYIANPRMGVMPAWGRRLDPATFNMLTVYVHALGGGE